MYGYVHMYNIHFIYLTSTRLLTNDVICTSRGGGLVPGEPNKVSVSENVYRKMVAVNTYICIFKMGTVPYGTVQYRYDTVRNGG